MEDFSQVYTVEYYGSKGWEVVMITEGLNEAIQYFRNATINEDGAFRLTTPTNVQPCVMH